jgi:hypothetical protein
MKSHEDIQIHQVHPSVHAGHLSQEGDQKGSVNSNCIFASTYPFGEYRMIQATCKVGQPNIGTSKNIYG